MKDASGQDVYKADFVLILEQGELLFGIVVRTDELDTLVFPLDGSKSYRVKVDDPKVVLKIQTNQVPWAVRPKMIEHRQGMNQVRP